MELVLGDTDTDQVSGDIMEVQGGSGRKERGGMKQERPTVLTLGSFYGNLQEA